MFGLKKAANLVVNRMKIKNFINGEFVSPASKSFIDNYNPSNGAIYAQTPDSNEEDVEKAYQAAAVAFPFWSTTSFEERSTILLKIAALIKEQSAFLAEAETKDNGKPISLSTSIDIPRAAVNFEFYAKAITQFSSEVKESVGQNAINLVLRESIGVVGCISPWNLPLYLFTWKIAPAIASGNCVVAKPSEITPMTAYLLGEICNEAGLPKGVLNIVQGKGEVVGDAIVKHPKIKAISFTGGTETGAKIATLAAPMFKKLTLELGGKNPNIIFADCNYEEMLDVTVKSSFSNQGQICLSGSRIFVEQTIYEKFKKDFIAKVSALKVGNPFDEATDIGALVSEKHLNKVQSYIDIVADEKATILLGGKTVTVLNSENGYYFEPTIIEVSDNKCRLNQEEIFGPIVTIMPFSTEEEVLEMANDVAYGLSATVWTNDLDRTLRVTKRIQAGIIWVNSWMLRDLSTPFGGVKASGMGREGGMESLRFFTEA